MWHRRLRSRPAVVIWVLAFVAGWTLAFGRSATLVEITPVTVSTQGFLSWALMDRDSGDIIGSSNADEPTDTASMIKAWLAADYLRRADDADRTPKASELAMLEAMIRDSDNEAADRAYVTNGGRASIDELISRCHLTNSKPDRNRWSNTHISARDTVRMGACLADGRAAGSWTSWLLKMMRGVRGEGDFGIRDALPAAERKLVAIKNGWLLRDEDNAWHTNCLAISDTWVMAVLQRYPAHDDEAADFDHTADVCAEQADQILATWADRFPTDEGHPDPEGLPSTEPSIGPRTLRASSGPVA